MSVPALPPRLVSRQRLLEALDRAEATAALTLVTAGPGGGKTVLLSEWAAARSPWVAWLALTPADDAPDRFWPLLLAALRSTPSVPLAAQWSTGSAAALLDALLSAEQDVGSPVTVVLDDAHVLTDPHVVDGLDRIVRRWSHRVRLVLATRSVPLLPIHQYRLSGQLAELRAADLAMTTAEAGQLLRAHSVVLPERETALLTRRTEGWTGGLRLAALRMEGAERPADFVAELAMDGGSIGEYLIAEVLSVLPEHVRRLLVSTSFLDVVTGDVAEAVTGLEGCEEALAALARTNSFVIPVDSSWTAFRYHQLFREVLRYLARRQRTTATVEGQRRAAQWLSAGGDVRGALQVALEGGDLALGRSLLLRGGLARALVGGQDLSGLPLADLVQDPPPGASAAELAEHALAPLAVCAARCTVDVGAGPCPPPEARAAVDDRADPELLLTGRLADVLLARATGRHDELEAAVDRLLADELGPSVEEIRGLRSTALLLRARARCSAGWPAEADPLLLSAEASAEHERAVGVQLEVLGLRALLDAHAARPRRCDEARAQAMALLGRSPGRPAPLTLDLAVALQSYRAADLATMAVAMERVRAAGPTRPDRELAGLIALLQSLLLSGSGDLGQARDWLRTPALSTANGLLAAHRDVALALLEVGWGRPQQAIGLLSPYGGTPYALHVAVPLADALLAAGDATGAERQVLAVLSSSGPQVDRAMLVSALLCRASVAEHRGQEALALEHLDQARELAGGDLVMPFVRTTRAFTALLARHPDVAARWPAAVTLPERLLLPRPRSPVGASDPLTEREMAVLRLLTSTMSTGDIADALFLSVNTVKTHLAAVYRKLGVARRRDAVLRARELELL